MAQRKKPDFSSADDKGITLQCDTVERYWLTNPQQRSNDAQFGRYILLYAYMIGFFLTLILAPILMPLLFKVLKDMLDDTNEENSYYFKLMFAGASTVSFAYSVVSIGVSFHQLSRSSDFPPNEFELMKICFLGIILVWLLLLTVLFTIYYHFELKPNSMKKMSAFFSALGLSTFSASLMLSFTPTVLLLFAYPVDTSALLALHVALFYSTTVVIAVFFNNVRIWIEHHRNIARRLISNCGRSTAIEIGICFGFFCQIFLGSFLLILLPLIYISIILLYQFVIARNESNELASSNIAKYIPPILIAVFGFLLNKGAFELPQKTRLKQEKKKCKNNAILLAQTVWDDIRQRFESKNSDKKLGEITIRELGEILSSTQPQPNH